MFVAGSADVQLQCHSRHCPARARPVAFTSTQTTCKQSPIRHQSKQLQELRQAPRLWITRQTFKNRCYVQTSTAAFQPQEVPVEQVQQPQPSSNAPKFRPFVPQTGVRQELLHYRYKVKVAGGTLHIRPLTQSWVHECGSLLTNAFADAMGYLPVYRTYLRHQIRQYLQRHAEMPPKAIVLIALLVPDPEKDSQEQQEAMSSRDLESQAQVSTSGQGEGSSSQQEGSTGQEQGDSSQQEASSGPDEDCKGILVGTVELSFVASTRARYLTLNAPPNCAYLANMAVDGNYRRRGYGNILLHAADAVTKIAGEKTIYLHLRFQDAAPAQLYKQAGYVPDKEDIFLVKLLGLDRRYLMKKTFVS